MIKRTRDFHIHATAYRLGNPKPDHTVAAVIDRCAELGLDLVGVGEHLNASAKHPLECLRPLVEEFRTIRPPMPCFVGAEVDVLDREGNVSCSAELKKELGLDYLLGAVHASPGTIASVREYVEEELLRHLGMMQNCPHVNVVAHPWVGGARWERDGSIPKWSFELVPEEYQDRLIESALRHAVAVEVNSRAAEGAVDEAYVRFVVKLKESGARIAIGSDAHNMGDIARALRIAEFLNGLGVDEEQLWQP